MAPETSEIAAAARLEQFFGRVGTHLKDRRKRESFAMYAFGILGDGERKSAEPIAARACADPEQTNNVHSKLLYFLGRSEWDDRAVRLEAARYVSVATKSEGPRIKNDEGSGRARSEGRVALFGLAQDVLHDAAIAAETHA